MPFLRDGLSECLDNRSAIAAYALMGFYKGLAVRTGLASEHGTEYTEPQIPVTVEGKVPVLVEKEGPLGIESQISIVIEPKFPVHDKL